VDFQKKFIRREVIQYVQIHTYDKKKKDAERQPNVLQGNKST